LVRKGLNQQKLARDIDFRGPGDRKSLWTTGGKTGFSRVHCEVPEQGTSARKVPILANFEADLKKYTCFF
jgi:hypothetical protein